MPENLIPLTVIKGAGHQFAPLPQGENATVADFHTIRIQHHLVPGDFAFFHVGSKVELSTKSSGFAFYAVTRPVKTPHPNLKDRAESIQSKSSKL
ncbi:hypothetical protein E8E11_008746 [Didymella keratinophila]|nr:hypothetical protein E8E11_008746 [Didymella keratinophila]